MSDLTLPAEVGEIVITIYEKGQLPDGRTILDFVPSWQAFTDERLCRPAFIRQVLTHVAATLPPDLPDNLTNPVELFPSEVPV